METGDMLDFPASSPGKIEASGPCSKEFEPGEINPLEFNHDDTKEKLQERHHQRLLTNENGGSLPADDADVHGDLVANSPVIEMDVELAEPAQVFSTGDAVSIDLTSEYGALPFEETNDAARRVACAIPTSSRKRARTEYDDNQPSVHVAYNSLTSSSRQKLEELLRQWSEWHSQHCSSSHGSGEELESGEETFFPALQVGVEKPSAVSFWIDHQTMRMENGGVVSFDTKTVPLYDRGYSLGLSTGDYSSNLQGGLEIIENAARCFNCGSYSHSLKECPKPRDNTAVNNARKQHKSKRNQNAASRNATRYYQDSPAGKFDGLKPGTLDSETRQLLGLGELDPPPWLNRMRELGYPPGYLEADAEDQPSGITIYVEEEVQPDQEDGEIAETGIGSPKKMTVKFPGINAPIPENADERRWGAGPSRSDSSRHRSHNGLNCSSLPIDIPNVRDHRWSGYVRDDPLPGTELGVSPVSFHVDSGSSHHSPIMSSSQHGWSHAVSRSSSERVGRSRYEDFSVHGYYSPRTCSSPGGQYSTHHLEGRYGHSVDEGRRYQDWDDPTWRRHSGRYRHHGWR